MSVPVEAPLDSASAFQFAAPPWEIPHWARLEELAPVVAELRVQLLATVAVFPAESSGFAFPDREAAWHLAEPG